METSKILKVMRIIVNINVFFHVLLYNILDYVLMDINKYNCKMYLYNYCFFIKFLFYYFECMYCFKL